MLSSSSARRDSFQHLPARLDVICSVMRGSRDAGAPLQGSPPVTQLAAIPGQDGTGQLHVHVEAFEERCKLNVRQGKL